MNIFKSQEQLIAEIHNEFDTAQERLLNDALEIISKNKSDGHNLANRLIKAGFTKNRAVIDYGTKSESLSIGLEQAKLIEYYKLNYPFLKFLDESELKRICKKYSLTIGPVENFVGDVPDKNLTEIENAQQLKQADFPVNLDYCLLRRDYSFCLTGAGSSWYSIWNSEFWRIPTRIDGHHFTSECDASNWLRRNMGFKKEYPVSSVRNFTEDRQGLFICAPASQFVGKNERISFIEIKDPIVFRYVRGGIQVITKWGLEANDPTLVVDKLN